MPKIVLFRGKAGVGKTFISTQVAARLNVPVIRKDDIFDTVFDYISDNELRNRFSYDLIHKFIDTNLESGTDVILDCPFHNHAQLLAMRQRIEAKNGYFKPILLMCSDEGIWADRFNERKLNPKPNNLITDFEGIKQHYERRNISLVPLDGELVLDTIEAAENIVERAVEYILRS